MSILGPQCPENWNEILGKCYFFVAATATFTNAAIGCSKVSRTSDWNLLGFFELTQFEA